jgi:hypothetical protein
MDAIEDFPYKPIQLQKVFNAFRDLLQHTKEAGLLQDRVQNEPETSGIDISSR